MGIPTLSVYLIDPDHTGSDCFQISNGRTKHEVFDETTRKNQRLITQQKSEFVGDIHTKALDIQGLQQMNNMNLSDTLLSVVSSHKCEWCKWCKCCKSHVSEATMEPQKTTIEIHQTAIDLQQTLISFQQTVMNQHQTTKDTQQIEVESWKKYRSTTEPAIADTISTMRNLKKRKWHRKFYRKNSGYSFTEAIRKPHGSRRTITQKSYHITCKGKDLSSSLMTPRTRNWLKRSKKFKKFKKVSSAKSTDDEGSFTATIVG